VGAVVAQRIVEFREENGRFTQTADLMLVRGIGEKTFELWRDHAGGEGEGGARRLRRPNLRLRDSGCGRRRGAPSPASGSLEEP
jgi:hypothetical protein